MTNDSDQKPRLKKPGIEWHVLGMYTASTPLKNGSFCAVRVSTTPAGPVRLSYQVGYQYPNGNFRPLVGIPHEHVLTYAKLLEETRDTVLRGIGQSVKALKEEGVLPASRDPEKFFNDAGARTGRLQTASPNVPARTELTATLGEQLLVKRAR